MAVGAHIQNDPALAEARRREAGSGPSQGSSRSEGAHWNANRASALPPRRRNGRIMHAGAAHAARGARRLRPTAFSCNPLVQKLRAPCEPAIRLTIIDIRAKRARAAARTVANNFSCPNEAFSASLRLASASPPSHTAECHLRENQPTREHGGVETRDCAVASQRRAHYMCGLRHTTRSDHTVARRAYTPPCHNDESFCVTCSKMY